MVRWDGASVPTSQLLDRLSEVNASRFPPDEPLVKDMSQWWPPSVTLAEFVPYCTHCVPGGSMRSIRA
jgi:hypothetical protein